MPLDQIDIEKDELPAEYRSQLPEGKLENHNQLTFIGHLDVLRKHIFRSALVCVAATIVVAFTISFFYDDIIMAPTRPGFITYRLLCELGDWINSDALCLEIKELAFYNRNMSGQFTMHLKSSFTIGVIIAFPFIIYQIWQFVKPGLLKNEKQATIGVVFFCSLLFFIGVWFAYYFVIPLSYQFFSTYTISESIVDEIDVSSYMAMFVDIVLACGIMFQLPMFVYILTKLGIIGPQFLITYRKHAAVVIMILSAVLTPSDVFSMVLLAMPLLLLYEISIVISKVVEARKNKLAEEL